MYQQQVNNNNNNISSTLDCCESRTVRTISTKHLQRQRQRQQPTVKVPALDFITENTIACKKSATKVAPTTEMQSVCQTRSLRRKPLMKTYALLPIICIIICAQICTTSGRTLLGRKQMLHSLQNRMQHHKNLMRYEREYAPKHTVQIHPHHHRIVRSNDRMACPENYTLFLTKLQIQSNRSRLTIMKDIEAFTKKRLNLTLREAILEWGHHKLNLSHSYADLINRSIDTNLTNFNFTHQQPSIELLRAELYKIFTTLKYLKIVYNDTVNNDNKVNWSHKYNAGYPVMIKFLEDTYAELTKTENVVNGIMESIKAPISIISPPEYNKTAQVREWLLVVESVSFLEYLTQLCLNLMEMCY